MVPQDLKFTKSHEWAKLDDAGDVTVGISDYATRQLGDIVYIELPTVGTAVTGGGAFGAVESVKAAVELYSPVGGEVVAANNDVEDDLDTISTDPYGQGWLMRVQASAPSELENLMAASDYEAYLESDECEGEADA